MRWNGWTRGWVRDNARRVSSTAAAPTTESASGRRRRRVAHDRAKREHATVNSPAHSDTHALPAGDFSAWLRDMRRALAGGPGMDVACGNCVGCCTSSYYIKVRPHETEALRHIPKEHRSVAQGQPEGTWLMGYDAQGHCPMFGAGGCSIYSNR